MRNFILLRGAPGSGKSTVAHCLAKLLDAEVVQGDNCWQWTANPTVEQQQAVYDEIANRANKSGRKYCIIDWVMHLEQIVDEVSRRLDGNVTVYTLTATEQVITSRIIARGGASADAMRAIDRLHKLVPLGQEIKTDDITAFQTAVIIKEREMLKSVENFVKEYANLMQPDKVVWITGEQAQLDALKAEALSTGEFIPLNAEKHPNCYLHRSARNDVARVEGRTFICCEKQEDAGPTNHWMAPDEAYKLLQGISKGAMKGRTMYVIPYSMGDVSSPFAKIGIELTDSIYVVISMTIMTRVGSHILDKIGDDFVRGIHTKAELSDEKRYICHFPQDNTIWTVNSGYGGNVLLGKKCFALRIASNLARKEGWLAEHMLIVGITRPNEETKYIAAAFPSACGKTNLAMLIPPQEYIDKGYKVETVGDDIAWLRVGKDGSLYAVNPENGFFGVAPGTSDKTNLNALLSCRKDSLFTNVALNTDDNTVWWEGMTKEKPAHLLDWQGDPYTEDKPYAAHPNSRFTAPTVNCPCLSSKFNAPEGVKISALVFGGRRSDTVPLIREAKTIEQGVFSASTMASQTTAAAAGKTGVLRRDPFAMLPFFGYHIGDYFAHWLEVMHSLKNPPRMYNVNWFIKQDGQFVWPGFGDNVRALDWILDRCDGKVGGVETPIGIIPNKQDINVKGTTVTEQQLDLLLGFDKEKWAEEAKQIEEFYDFIGDRVPKALRDELSALKEQTK